MKPQSMGLVPIKKEVVLNACENWINSIEAKNAKLKKDREKYHEERIQEHMKPFLFFKKSRKSAERQVKEDNLEMFYEECHFELHSLNRPLTLKNSAVIADGETLYLSPEDASNIYYFYKP